MAEMRNIDGYTSKLKAVTTVLQQEGGNDLEGIISELESEEAKELQKELHQLSHNLFRMGYRGAAKYAIIYGLGVAAGERRECAKRENKGINS